ncbi:alkaline phosphatase family protein [Methylococcus sp. ANG]|uniref:phospholipase C n=1 Tax=Methylococcus sp. ANG TaxID=3231903 RepID=UPI00345A95B8
MHKPPFAASLLAACLGTGSMPSEAVTPAQIKKVKHFVVIYQENHSFDNLLGDWEGVNGRKPGNYALQVNQAGEPFECLLQNDSNLTSPSPLATTCVDAANNIESAFANAPFSINTYGTDPSTEDLTHRFYQHQYQLNGGKMNRFVTGSEAVGLTMAYYDTKALPIYQYLHRDGHPRYAVADNFFQAAFGGSFLNHQWLVAARTPIWPNAVNDGGKTDQHSVVDENGMPVTTSDGYPLYTSPLGKAVYDGRLTASCNPPAGRAPTPAGVACGDYAINTTQPNQQPYSPGTKDYKRLPLQTAPTIGDRLSAAGISWGWYAEGWSNANGNIGAPGWTNGTGPKCTDSYTDVEAVFPNCVNQDFQYHHQPFNYFKAFDASTKAGKKNRKVHLRDEVEFVQLANRSTKTCKLRQVSFVKPLPAGSEHPGGTQMQGREHLVALLEAVENSACAKHTMVIVTYDEFGGQYDHVQPPGQGQGNDNGPHDQWGPGSRIPALVVSPLLPYEFGVDSTQYDTTSILATLEKRYRLAPVSDRDAQVNDMFSVFDAAPPATQSAR